MVAKVKKTKKPRRSTKKAREPSHEVVGEQNGHPVWRVRVADLQAADYNPREITDRALSGLRSSVEEFGMVQAVVLNRRTGNVVGGHQRLRTLDPNASTDVVVVDLDLPREKALNVALNNPQMQGDWTSEISDLLSELRAEVPELSENLMLDSLFADITNNFNFNLDDLDADPGLSDNYSRKIEAPIYEPTEEDQPDEAELYDRTKTDALTQEIKRAKGLDSEVRAFLINSAERHTVFRFDRIAEYYAHAPKEVQGLMERSALVIIDFGQAVELGFVKLTKAMLEQAGIAQTEDGDA